MIELQTLGINHRINGLLSLRLDKSIKSLNYVETSSSKNLKLVIALAKGYQEIGNHRYVSQ
jgi:hypothetical protein